MVIYPVPIDIIEFCNELCFLKLAFNHRLNDADITSIYEQLLLTGKEVDHRVVKFENHFSITNYRNNMKITIPKTMCTPQKDIHVKRHPQKNKIILHTSITPPPVEANYKINLIETIDAKNIFKTYKQSLLNVNLQSINSNINELRQLIKDLEEPSYISSVIDMWKPNLPLIKISGYQAPLLKMRQFKRGNGVAIWVRNDIDYKVEKTINDLIFAQIEHLAIETTYAATKTTIVTIYRPPNSKPKESLEELELLIKAATNLNNPLIITGDLNIDTNKPHHPETKKYLEILDNYQLSQLITHPTRITSHLSTCIDHHILTNSKLNANAMVLKNIIADHQPIAASWQKIKIKNKRQHQAQPTESVKHQKIDLELTKESLMAKNWVKWWAEMSTKDTNTIFNSLHQEITSSMVEKHHKYAPKHHWTRPESIAQIKLINRPKAKKTYKKTLKRDKQKYYQNEIRKAKKDSKKIWKVINQILERDNKNSSKPATQKITHKDLSYEKDNEIACAFNNYYQEMAPKLAKTIKEPNASFKDFLANAKTPSVKFSIQQTNEETVSKVIQNFAPNSSSGFDKISHKILKFIAPTILHPLTAAINHSYREGIFPQIQKTAKLQPLFKSGDKTKPENYRPISQLGVISKVMEKVATNQLNDHLENENLLSDKQFGYRKGHSTEHALMITRHEIEKAQNENKYTILITMDLSKAFDTVNSDEILPQKLEHYGCDKTAVNWFSSFFKDRNQYVTWNNTKSTTVQLSNISVVQGSSMGTPCFLVYINDLAEASKFKSVLFADDTNLIMSDLSLETLAQAANSELEKIQKFMACNKLSLNLQKCAYMIFSPQKNSQHSMIKINIGQHELKEVTEFKFLGVTLDNKLTFKTHFENIINKMRQGLKALRLTKTHVNYRAKFLIYNGLIKPSLDYCHLVWISQLSNSQIKKMTMLQKKSLRLIFNAKYAHTSKMFELSKITKVKDIQERDSLILMHKFKQGILPTVFNDVLNHNFESQNIEKVKPGNIAYNTLAIWNKTNPAIRAAKSINCCKRQIKIHQQEESICHLKNCYSCKISEYLSSYM
jgi:hypothetical protein